MQLGFILQKLIDELRESASFVARIAVLRDRHNICCVLIA